MHSPLFSIQSTSIHSRIQQCTLLMHCGYVSFHHVRARDLLQFFQLVKDFKYKQRHNQFDDCGQPFKPEDQNTETKWNQPDHESSLQFSESQNREWFLVLFKSFHVVSLFPSPHVVLNQIGFEVLLKFFVENFEQKVKLRKQKGAAFQHETFRKQLRWPCSANLFDDAIVHALLEEHRSFCAGDVSTPVSSKKAVTRPVIDDFCTESILIFYKFTFFTKFKITNFLQKSSSP